VRESQLDEGEGGWSPCKKKSKAKGGGAAWFRPNTKKIRFRFFRGCPKFLSLKIVLCQFFFPPLCIWLDVNLYRKSLHVLFKKILQ